MRGNLIIISALKKIEPFPSLHFLQKKPGLSLIRKKTIAKPFNQSNQENITLESMILETPRLRLC